MAQEITNVQETAVVGPAIPTEATRKKAVQANPAAYVDNALEAIARDTQNYGEVVKAHERLTDVETKNAAAREYIDLVQLRDYINMRLDEIKGAVFGTLNDRVDLDETVPEWVTEATPSEVVPGEIEVEDYGIKFQRAGGAPKPATVDEKALAKAHPRIYKNFVKKQVIPAVAEQVVEVFDTDAFVAKAEKDAKLRQFVKDNYGTVSFRVHNLFDK